MKNRRMPIIVVAICAACLFAVSAARAGAAGERPAFVTLCYHNVEPASGSTPSPDMVSITLSELTDQFDWLRDNGYTAVSVEDILKANKGLASLPPKAVLLSFDDGYESFYRLVYPLLRAYKYPAMLALETTWLETPPDQPVDYGSAGSLPRSYFLKWKQIKEMADSGLVELAGHSHNLHRGHRSNPQGVPQPAAATLAYNPANETYESEETFYRRIKQDLRRNADIIFRHTGYRPRVLAWPYGRYTQTGVKAALDAGYVVTASLSSTNDWPTFGRFMVYAGMNINEVMGDLAMGLSSSELFMPATYDHEGNTVIGYRERSILRARYPLQRVMHADLDMVYDPDPAQQHANISKLFDRVEAMRITTVYLQAFADPDGDGVADALYFPNRHLPMRADLFNYVSWQLMSRLNVQVYAWMPVLGFQLRGDPQLVQASPPDKAGSKYLRLSPFEPRNRKNIAEIYRDLAMHSCVAGLLFHDDALLGDHEDAGPAGRDWLRKQGLPDDPRTIHGDPELLRRAARAKSRALTDFTLELRDAFGTWSPPVRTSRNIYAEAILNPDAETWFAQNFDDFLSAYDYTAIMAMPYMEGAADPVAWLEKLAATVKKHPLGAEKSVFELQAVDWQRKRPISSDTLAEQMKLLQRNGIGSMGYYPENPITGHPDVGALSPYFSVQDNPFLMKRIVK